MHEQNQSRRSLPGSGIKPMELPIYVSRASNQLTNDFKIFWNCLYDVFWMFNDVSELNSPFGGNSKWKNA